MIKKMRSGKIVEERGVWKKGKYRMRRIVLPLLLLLLLFCGCTYPGTVHIEAIQTARGEVISTIRGKNYRAGRADMRSYEYPDGGEFLTARLSIKSECPQKITLCELRGEQATLRWYNEERDIWYQKPLAEGVYWVDRPIIETEEQSVLITMPMVYRAHENAMLEYLPDYKSTLSVKRISGGWRLILQLPELEKGLQVEWHAVLGEGAIIDWNAPDAQTTWKKYLLTGENRWCYEGYYYEAPASYIPSGENYFHLLPAAYLTERMAADEQHRAAYYLSIGMLDTMLTQQNEYGFLPTHAGSTWLRDSYQIGPGFYDTRFNSDLMETLLDAYVRYGVEKFAQPVRDYLDFFIQHAEQHHTAFGDGWMINDYSHPNGGSGTVSSLNHQLAELLLLYQAGEAFHTDEYDALAARMLRGIENSEQIWYRADGNLEYGVEADGITIYGVDYPYLTYDDLLKVSRWRASHGMEPSPAIERLLAYKLKYMQKHGITGYLQ